MRKKMLIAAGIASLAILVGSITPVEAVCTAPRAFSTVTADFTSYVYRADIIPIWGGTYTSPTPVYYGPVPSIDFDFNGVFWSLTGGDPAVNAGNDNGALAPYGYWMYYGGTTGGSYYPFYMSGSWSQGGVDGCIDLDGSDPALPDDDQCMAVLLEDADGAGNSFFALLTQPRDGSSNYRFGGGADVVLQPIPKPRIKTSNRVSNSQVDLTVELDSPLAGPADGLYLNCGVRAAVAGVAETTDSAAV